MQQLTSVSFFKEKRFLPFFITQFCGAFNDCILKNALTMLITYKLSATTPINPIFLILLVNAIFIAPFIFLAGLAGQLADRFERSTLIKLVKFAEVFITLLALRGFHQENILLLLISILLMGIHSTFFGPLKYAILPDHLAKHELMRATGYVEGGTFIAILAGMSIGNLYTIDAQFIDSIMWWVAAIGLGSSFFIPRSNNFNPEVALNFNIWQGTINTLKEFYDNKSMFYIILGISWFWFIGASFIAQLPPMTKNILGGDEGVATLFLMMFLLGLGAGSFICSLILGNEITTRYVFMSAIGMSIFSTELFFATKAMSAIADTTQLQTIPLFLSYAGNWRILIDLFLLACISGIYVVPLYASMQCFINKNYRSRVVASNNLYNSLFMIASTILLSVVFLLGFSILEGILLISIINLMVALYSYRLISDTIILPYSFLRTIGKFLLDKCYRVQIKGLEHLAEAGDKVVIIANHLSYLDAALIAAYFPAPLTFAVNKEVAEYFWMKPLLRMVRYCSIDSSNPLAAKTLVEELQEKRKVVIFPEGKVTLTGSLMKVYEGPGMIADIAGAMILPVAIDGPQYTIFSKIKRLIKPHLFPKITINILPPVRLTAPEALDNRQRRKYIGQKLYDLMSEMLFESAQSDLTLFGTFLKSAKLHGYRRLAVQDHENNRLTYRQLLTRIFTLGKVLARTNEARDHVGLMLPNSTGTVAVFYAMQAFGLVPSMINFTNGSRNILLGIQAAKIHVVYTSRRFIEKAELSHLIEAINKQVKVVYLEDLRSKITIWNKLEGLLGSFFPALYSRYLAIEQNSEKTAVVLFTSGTEGIPKGVALSHQNITANLAQMLTRFDFNQSDIAFNALPLFHSFGLIGMILMLTSGTKTFLYPSPLHYRIIPEVVYDVSATILFSSDTFLKNYAKYAHPYDFYSLRYVFAGAEKLKKETYTLWLETFGIRIFEGYGTTETSPVVSANAPMHNNPNTAGRLLPGIQYSLQPVEGIETGGRLYVKGANIMLGYLTASNPGIIQEPIAEELGKGWHDTGDIAKIDEQGYIEIIDRAKRFAKLAGEMVSLTAIEQLANQIDSAAINAAVILQDDQKGEEIILVTNSNIISKTMFLEALKTAGFTELYCPRVILYCEQVPVLATGKLNYQATLAIVQEAKNAGTLVN